MSAPTKKEYTRFGKMSKAAMEIRNASRKVKKVYKCEICGKADFETQGDAINHVRKEH